MIWLDFAIIGVVALATLLGLSRGLTKELLSLAAWIGSLVIAAYFAGHLAPEVESLINKGGCISVFAAFAALFVVAFIVLGILNTVLGTFIFRGKRTLVDRIFGLLFGFVKGSVVVLTALLMVSVLELPIDKWWPGSQITPMLQDTVADMRHIVERIVEENLADLDCDELQKR